MPTFVHPTLLTIGLAIAAVPVLIHLINMMRHKRVEWAAMEFLLVSQKKHRTWIIFKQLLLLLLRMAAIAAIAMYAAEPLLKNRFSQLFGQVITHHVILLDDSYSMSDRWDDTNAFHEAKNVIARIGGEAEKQNQRQSLTLLRFSRVGKAGRPTQTDFLNERVTKNFSDNLKKVLDKLDTSQTDAGPVESLKALDEMLGDPEGERRILYVISDFRARQWNDPTDAKKYLLRWQAADADIHLIDCVDRARPNLSIVSLQPEEGVRAAGVHWFMEVVVANHGASPAKNISLTLSEDNTARPSLSIQNIPPGKTAKERFQVSLRDPGWHTITARLDSDAVSADNYRYYAVDLPPDRPVLLIDGDPKPKDAKFLDLLLNPGGTVKTGLRPAIETARYLSTKPLNEFASINLANIDRLDKSAIAALEKYVTDGGGVAFYLGDLCQTKFINQELYREGKGLFPLPLKGPAELVVDRLEAAPDVQTEPHFIFRVFGEKRNSLLQSLAVEKYFAAVDKWQPSAAESVRVLAKLRNGAPLIVEKSFGKGRVLAVLTTAAPTWNNFARNPAMVPLMLDIQAYLGRRSEETPSRAVGSPLELVLDPARYLPQVRFVTPQEAGVPSATVDAAVGTDKKLHAQLADTDVSGYYEALLTRSENASGDNKTEKRRFAFNVEPEEGDLAALDQSQLAERLTKDDAKGNAGLKYQFDKASEFQTDQNDAARNNMRDAVMYALILLLIGEQMLAYTAGYHPRAMKNTASAGGAA